MFGKKTIEYYEKALVEGEFFLVRNRLLKKYTERRSDVLFSDGCYQAKILAFYATSQHVNDTYQRYEYLSTVEVYKKCTVGEYYYLLLAPKNKNSDCLYVKEIFPCKTTELNSNLKKVLERDTAYTGFPVALETEEQELAAWLEQENLRIRENKYQSETVEEKNIRLQKESDQKIFAEIAAKFLKISGFVFFLPLLILGCVLLFRASVWSAVCFIGGCFLFVLSLLLLIIFKKPLVARKKKRLGIDK